VTDTNVNQDSAPVKAGTGGGYISDPQLRRRWGNISHVSLWRLRQRDPRAPKPFQSAFSRNCNMNRLADVEAYEVIVEAEGDGESFAARSRSMLERKRARQRPADYPAAIPDRLPPGSIIVHNHVKPAQRQGTRGFQFWIAKLGDDDRYVACKCDWAPHLGKHYRVDRERK
jgi:hypothetical protein